MAILSQRAWGYLTLAIVAFSYAFLTLVFAWFGPASCMEHFTEWTFVMQTLLWSAISFLPAYHSRRASNPMGEGVLPDIVSQSIAPIVIPIQLAVALGVTFIIPQSSIVATAVWKQGNVSVWIYNFVIHYLPATMSVLYALDHGVQLRTGTTGMNALVNVSCALTIFIAYFIAFDIRRIYGIRTSTDLAFVLMSMTLVLCHFLYRAIVSIPA